MLTSFSFSPLDLEETEQLSPGQKVEFSGHSLNHSEKSRAILETRDENGGTIPSNGRRPWKTKIYHAWRVTFWVVPSKPVTFGMVMEGVKHVGLWVVLFLTIFYPHRIESVLHE
jgi:hypothetical protein